MSINNERSVAGMLEGGNGGLKSAFLHSTEPLLQSDYNEPTLRINTNFIDTNDTGEYSGILYPHNEDRRSIQVSFEDGSNFPEDVTAQGVLTDYDLDIEAGTVVHYTIMPDYGAMKDTEEGLSNHSRDNQIDSTDLDRL